MHAMTKDFSNNKFTIKMEMRQDRCYIILCFHFYDKLTVYMIVQTYYIVDLYNHVNG